MGDLWEFRSCSTTEQFLIQNKIGRPAVSYVLFFSKMGTKNKGEADGRKSWAGFLCLPFLLYRSFNEMQHRKVNKAIQIKDSRGGAR